MTDALERTIRFGSGERLLGIVTPAPQPLAGAPVCLLFNAGVVHRIGPHRLNVKLARALAARGFTALRMDHATARRARHRRGHGLVTLTRM